MNTTCVGRERVVEMLISGGADRSVKNKNGKFAKDLAIEKGNANI